MGNKSAGNNQTMWHEYHTRKWRELPIDSNLMEMSLELNLSRTMIRHALLAIDGEKKANSHPTYETLTGRPLYATAENRDTTPFTLYWETKKLIYSLIKVREKNNRVRKDLLVEETFDQLINDLLESSAEDIQNDYASLKILNHPTIQDMMISRYRDELTKRTSALQTFFDNQPIDTAAENLYIICEKIDSLLIDLLNKQTIRPDETSIPKPCKDTFIDLHNTLMSARSERRFYKEGASQHFIEFRYDVNDKNQDITASLKEYLPMDVNEIYLRRDKDRLRQLSKVYDRFLFSTLSDKEKQAAKDFYDSYKKMQHYKEYLKDIFDNLYNFDFDESARSVFVSSSISDQFIRARLEHLHQEILMFFHNQLRLLRIAYPVIYPHLKLTNTLVEQFTISKLYEIASEYCPTYLSHQEESITKLSNSIAGQIYLLQENNFFPSPFFPDKRFSREQFLSLYREIAEPIFGDVYIPDISTESLPIQKLILNTCILDYTCRIIASQKLDEWVATVDKEVSQLESFWK